MKEEDTLTGTAPAPETAPAPAPPPPERPRPWWDRALGWFGWLLFFAVIAVLVLGSQGGYSGTVSSTKKTEAKVMATTIANSVDQYYTEYSRLPLPRVASPGPGGDTDTDTSRGAELIADLLGKVEGGGNTRRQDFLDGFKQARMAPDLPGGWKNGLVYEESPGPYFAIIDPWGLPFRVRLDTGGDNGLENPNPDQAAQGKTRLRKRVILWSAGKDGKWETWEDNVMSWE